VDTRALSDSLGNYATSGADVYSRSEKQQGDKTKGQKMDTQNEYGKESPLKRTLCNPEQLKQDKVQLYDVHLEEGR